MSATPRAKSGQAAGLSTSKSKLSFEQEGQLEALFAELKGGFQKLETLNSTSKQQALLKDLKSKMQEAKT